MVYKDRAEAGRLLAEQLGRYAKRPATIVLGIPRGGVVVAHEVAQALHLPLDAFVVRKLGVPGQEELAMGAIASHGFYLLNQDVINSLRISESEIRIVLRKEQRELQRRERLYRRGRPPLNLSGQTVILVDDGLATGASARAALRILKRQHPAKMVLAIPVAPTDTCESLRKEVDELVCLMSSEVFYGIGTWYENFNPTSDEEVSHLLKQDIASSAKVS